MILKLGTVSPEVARWQGVIGLPQSGIFDAATDKTTRAWQIKKGLDPDGVVGPKTWAASGVISQTNTWYPPKPNFGSPTNQQRTQMFGSFAYKRKNSTDIVITDDWAQKNIVKIKIPQLVGVSGAPKDGVILVHKRAADPIRAFFQEVEDKGLKDRIISWAGSFYPRFIRGSQSTLSNHSWGTAFDINAPENWLGAKPAALGKRGCLLELVPIANKHGFYWGGHYSSRLDGMHFELAKIPQASYIAHTTSTPPVPSVTAAPDPLVDDDDVASNLLPEGATSIPEAAPESAGNGGETVKAEITAGGDVTVEKSGTPTEKERIAVVKIGDGKSWYERLWLKISGKATGDIATVGITDKFEQAQAFGLSYRFWYAVAAIIIIASLVWLIHEIVKDYRQKKKDDAREALIVQTNSTEGNIVQLIDKGDVDLYRMQNYKIVTA